MIKIFSDQDVLSEEFRKKVIEEINSPGNKSRKREMLKRQEVYRDNVIKWVMEALNSLNLRPETLQMMKNHAANISIAKKIVNKKARCYRGTIQRQATGGDGKPDDEASGQISLLAQMLQTNQQMQKADRFCVLQKNALPWIFPEMMPNGKWRLKSVTLTSSQYDVIENGRDPEKPAAVILSDYIDDQSNLMATPGGGWRSIDQASVRTDETAIGDGPQSYKSKASNCFIWWTDTYHFTTNEKGQIMNSLSPIDLKNPIGMIPGAPVAEDQDGSYWAAGGEDLIDGSVLVNVMLTDILSIMYLQGFGQLVLAGPNIPEQYQVGPNVALVMSTREGAEKPEAYLLQHNPPIDGWLRMIEQYVAMLLSTNDLSPSAIAIKLDAVNFPSGIAMLIEKSEAQGSVEDRRHNFSEAERRYWEIVRRWLEVYEGLLDQQFEAVGQLPDDLDVSVRYSDAKEVTTEKERLEVMKLRKDLGLATQLDLVQMDNPSMTKEEAEAKLLELKAELGNAAAAAAKKVEEMNGSNKPEDDETDPNDDGTGD